MKKWLLRTPSAEDLIQVLKAWRVWLLAAIVGSLLGFVFHFLFPPDYRAQASVNVDHNLELAWPDASKERDLMTYLSRETQKLEELAWDDATLQVVVDENPGTSISILRSGVLQLSQPGEGAWHFWADHSDPVQAERLASSWAQAFYDRSLKGLETAIQLQAAQATLLQPGTDKTSLTQEVIDLEKITLGISPYLQIHLSQVDQLPVKPAYNFMASMLIGMTITWLFSLLVILLVGKKPVDHGNP
ncbi:hypothetical protein ACFLXB_05955 [Chloroflexota bacterium]